MLLLELRKLLIRIFKSLLICSEALIQLFAPQSSSSIEVVYKINLLAAMIIGMQNKCMTSLIPRLSMHKSLGMRLVHDQ